MPEPRPVETVKATIAALRAEHPSVESRGWDFDGFRIRIDSNEPRLLATLDRYFADFRPLDSHEAGPITRIGAIQLTDPPDFGAGRRLTVGEHKPSVRGPKEAFFDALDGRVIHKLRTGMWFLFGRDEHLAIGPCTDNPNQVINFINNRMIQWALHRGALLGHASAVCHAQAGALPRAVVIAGFSGMGKSTLALHLLGDRRLDFLSNDRVMMRAAGASEPAMVLGVPKHPRINPGTILHNPDLAGILDAHERSRFEALTPAELWQLEHKYDAPIRECFPDQRFFLRAEFAGLVLLNWFHARETGLNLYRNGGPTRAARIDVAERRELLPALIKEPGVFYRPGAGDVSPEEERYIEFLRGVPVLELSGGVDFDFGRAAALELLGL